MKQRTEEIGGQLWINQKGGSYLGHGRIELLEHIGLTGSITKAAKAMKMSYKAAWDAVDAMNNLAPKPLVARATGGKGGGGTQLTPYGKEVIAAFKAMEAEHQRFLERLSAQIDDLTQRPEPAAGDHHQTDPRQRQYRSPFDPQRRRYPHRRHHQ